MLHMQPVTHVVMLHTGHVKNVASYTRSMLNMQPVTHVAILHMWPCYTGSPVTHVTLLHM